MKAYISMLTLLIISCSPDRPQFELFGWGFIGDKRCVLCVNFVLVVTKFASHKEHHVIHKDHKAVAPTGESSNFLLDDLISLNHY